LPTCLPLTCNILLFAYTENRLLNTYNATVFENWAITVTIDQKRYTVNLFDTAGQEDYAHIRCLSYPHTDVFLICFSLVDPKTLDSCKEVWYPELRKYFGKDLPTIVLVGTKEDLVESVSPSQRVSSAAAQHVAHDIGAVCFVECSSLTLRGVKRVFDESFLAAIGRSPVEKSNQQCCCLC
uniref:Rho-related GTP-binding protein RhoU n=1 Tax=Syphacia muris TaxID=451379 RepID=A0A0N5AX19_9BILA